MKNSLNVAHLPGGISGKSLKNSSNKNQYSFKGFAKNEIILNSEIERLTPVYIPQELVNDISIKFTKDNNFTDKERTEYSEIYYDFEMFNDYLKIFNGNVLYQDNIDFFTDIFPAARGLSLVLWTFLS